MTSEIYFSEREGRSRARTSEKITQATWGGVVTAINSRIDDESFGYRFPDQCEEVRAVTGCDRRSFSLTLAAEHPDIPWPLDPSEPPPTLAILDLLEFCCRSVGEASVEWHHGYWHHDHLRFDPAKGQELFIQDMNRLFSRAGLVFEMQGNGQVVRLAPPVLRESLQTAVFHTGDSELDTMLEAARTKFLSPDLCVRREALEKLWDAWERLKTIEPGKERDKKSRVETLLNNAAFEPKFRALIDEEGKVLTEIGNEYQIRHSEVWQTQLRSSDQVDYLFHRLYALIQLLLRSTNWGG